MACLGKVECVAETLVFFTSGEVPQFRPADGSITSANTALDMKLSEKHLRLLEHLITHYTGHMQCRQRHHRPLYMQRTEQDIVTWATASCYYLSEA